MPAIVRGKCLTLPLAIAMALAMWTGTTSRASAQGLLQSLFGFGSPPPRLPPQMYYPQQRPGSPFPSSRPNSSAGAGGETGGSFRTLCVRMCDGYYFPVSHGVTRSHFARDSQACQSSCGSDARLFYAPSNGGAEDMVDLGGRSYTQIPNAFKYRKALSPSCACKPVPWSQAELTRHQRYAAEENRAATIAASQPAARNATDKVAASEKDKTKAAPSASARSNSVVIVDPLAKQTGSQHGVQKVEASPGPPAAGQPRQMQTDQGQAVLSQPPTPVTVLPRAAGLQPVPRPAARMGIGGPPAQVKVASKPSVTSSVPVYSHEQGRFVFPGDNRYR